MVNIWVLMMCLVGLLEGRPEFGFEFAPIETPEGYRPARQQVAQQLAVSLEVIMGEAWTQVSTLTDGTT
jgi:hypothetical protein